jgi:hypothetical protein
MFFCTELDSPWPRKWLGTLLRPSVRPYFLPSDSNANNTVLKTNTPSKKLPLGWLSDDVPVLVFQFRALLGANKLDFG